MYYIIDIYCDTKTDGTCQWILIVRISVQFDIDNFFQNLFRSLNTRLRKDTDL